VVVTSDGVEVLTCPTPGLPGPDPA